MGRIPTAGCYTTAFGLSTLQGPKKNCSGPERDCGALEEAARLVLAPVANYASLSRKAAEAENNGDAGITCLLARGRVMVRERLSSQRNHGSLPIVSAWDLERSHA